MSASRLCAASAALASLLAVQAFAQPTPPEPAGPPTPPLVVRDFRETPAFKVIRVVEGDTVVLSMDGRQKRVGLIGVALPEGTPVLDAARRALANLLEGEQVFVEYDARWNVPDRGGRDWAYVFRAPDGLFTNFEMIRQGYARVASEDFDHAKLFRAYETRAQQSRKGIWGAPPPAPTSDNGASAKPRAAPAETEPRAARPPKSGASENKEARPAAPDAAGSDVMVYVTATGKRYHKQDCEHVKKSGRPMSLRDAKGKGLTPCQSCEPPE
ncbi:MAG: thermonuclease family protein [Phycisphaerae bacterium]